MSAEDVPVGAGSWANGACGRGSSAEPRRRPRATELDSRQRTYASVAPDLGERSWWALAVELLVGRRQGADRRHCATGFRREDEGWSERQLRLGKVTAAEWRSERATAGDSGWQAARASERFRKRKNRKRAVIGGLQEEEREKGWPSSAASTDEEGASARCFGDAIEERRVPAELLRRASTAGVVGLTSSARSR